MNGEEISGETTPFGDQENKNIIFTGKQWDEDAELYYFNARWYDPETGRFITEDPIKSGMLWYTYCNNSPMNFIDPTGLNAEDRQERREERHERREERQQRRQERIDAGNERRENIKVLKTDPRQLAEEIVSIMPEDDPDGVLLQSKLEDFFNVYGELNSGPGSSPGIEIYSNFFANSFTAPGDFTEIKNRGVNVAFGLLIYGTVEWGVASEFKDGNLVQATAYDAKGWGIFVDGGLSFSFFEGNIENAGMNDFMCTSVTGTLGLDKYLGASASAVDLYSGGEKISGTEKALTLGAFGIPYLTIGGTNTSSSRLDKFYE